MTESLLPFFSPLGVVVIGASTSPEKLGYGVARNLIASGYQGMIHFVSQKTGELFERPLYTDLAQVPDPVDLAILIVPPNATPETLKACGARGIHAAIIVSAGFREAGPEGAALEAECLAVARAHGIRLLGPNCIGTINPHLRLDTTFLQPPMPAAGHIGFVSHSGAFCAAIIDWARAQGFGFSQLVSLGNQADVNETDMLPMVAADEHTRVIVLYMESVSDGRRFVEAARAVTRRKPVIALKVGRFEAGQKAAASHTGALAGSESAFEAAFEKAGILRADSAEQMFDWARALENCPLPRGKNMAILTNAGGPGVIAADSLDHAVLFAASRYGKGGGADYLNAPMDREQYHAFVAALRAADTVPLKEFERDVPFFEGCLPIEVMAERGVDTLRWGPMKPVGLPDPRTGRPPFAVVQLRRDDLACEQWNIVGFQTRMTFSAQQRVFRLIPGLERARFVRLGMIHRNSFICAPRHLDATLRLVARGSLRLAGQITGVEGYVESAATGLLAGLHLAAELRAVVPPKLPGWTAHGGLIRHLTLRPPRGFQPANAAWGLMIDPPIQLPRDKGNRRLLASAWALESIREWRAALPWPVPLFPAD